MESTLEIRKVPIGSIYGLIQVLESSDSWKKLMSYIPKELENSTFIPKYGTDHMNLIETAGFKQKRPCTEILFEEWGTSGRNRPTLGTLLQILMEAELFRAADIVAVDLLNSSPPKRPVTGPAAKIDVSLPHILADRELNKMNVESLLNNMSYPNLTADNLNTFNKNIDNKITPEKSTEKYNNFLTIPNSGMNNSNISVSTGPSVLTKSTNVSNELSNMIQFSADYSNSNLSQRSSVNLSENLSEGVGIPAISMLLSEGESVSREDNETPNQSNDVMKFQTETGGMMSNSTSNANLEAVNMNVTNVSMTTSSEYNMPDFNVIQSDSGMHLPNISILQRVSRNDTNSNLDFNIPELSALQFKFKASENSLGASLPITSASLNTILPHISYKELQRFTNNFNDVSHDESLLSSRKIGAGGFGTVYLTNGLFDLPVAVKKLKLFGPAGQYCEPIISKQFKTEVEILSKYNHDNILSLLGYSCDGPNYCVIYEYIEGGSLRENISSGSSLSTQTRMNIALDSARGIEYLHYGFQTPLIHRDIKSANILLTKSYVPKLCDFGLVKLLPNQTVTSNIMGTTAYMAPEAFRGDVSVKMDVFSFGVVLLELLTGLAPLDDTRPGTDIVTHVDDMCSEGVIEPLLDKSVGNWGNAELLFSLAKRCLEEKRKRPLISDVVEKLRDLF